MSGEGKILRNDNFIELNGKRYDALTGKLLGESPTPVTKQLIPERQSVRAMDSVVRVHTPKPKPPTSKQLVAHKPRKKRKSTGVVVRAHHPQPAKTLMRRAVHKPKTGLKPAIKTQTPSEIMAAPISAVTRKHSANSVNPTRSLRARQTPRHNNVQRFSPLTDVRNRSLSAHPARRPASSIAPTAGSTPAAHKSRPHQDMFEAAIAHAKSHEQPAHKSRTHKKHRRLAGTLAAVGALLILGGFFTYLSLPRLELRIASLSAGFSAQMPGYNPTGYKLTNVEHKHGAVTLSFRSGDGSYQITQQASNWNSQTLGDSIGVASADNETVESKGRIIYVYDGAASWVDRGIRYDITGNAYLSKSDIVDIATSL